ncbi:MAG: DUF5915 domain-containing protein, partial [Halobacteria archaeon]|nr:DUF5915 domain-containing protein [Halobacteria archaeon]
VVRTDDDQVEESVRGLKDLLLERSNAKTLEVTKEDWDEVTYRAVPQMDVLGPKYGENANKVLSALEGTTRSELRGSNYRVKVNGKTVDVTDEMVEFREETPENVESADFDGGTVYVDASLNEDLEAEGYSREVVRRVQEMRKELDLDVDEPIKLSLDVHDDKVAELVERESEFIAEETRAVGFVDSAQESVREWEVEGVKVVIGIETL